MIKATKSIVSVQLAYRRSLHQGMAHRRRPRSGSICSTPTFRRTARPEHREITDQLYGGDILKRIRQEIVLGIGGLRALAKLGIKPTVHHMNEGHSAFLAVERIRVLMQENNFHFDQALEATRVSNVFTTHTSVPAGIDLFDSGLMYEYFSDYCREAGIRLSTGCSLGRRNPQDCYERFSMAVLALKHPPSATP